MISLSFPFPSPPKLSPHLKPPTPKPSLQNVQTSIQSVVNNSKTPNFELLKDRLIREANVGRVAEAISTLDFMTQNGLNPDLTSYSVLLKSCIRTRNLDMGMKVHSKLAKSGLEPDSLLLNSLISLYSKCGDWATAKAIFESMGSDKRDTVSWSAMISCFAHHGMEVEAINTFFDMVEFGDYPNQFCFAAVLQACWNLEFSWIGMVVFGFLIKTGYFESDVCVGCALIDLFVKGFRDLDLGKKVFDKMPERNPVTWTLMITRYAQLGQPRYAIELFVDMVLSGFTPDRFTLSSILAACAELGILSLGLQLHSWVVKCRLCWDVCVGCSLVDMYAKCSPGGLVDDSRKVFDRLSGHNVMSSTATITAYVQSGGRDEEALKIYSCMLEDQVLPNHFTFSSLLKGCGNLCNPGLGEMVYAHAVKLGVASVSCVGNSLISMYAQSGRMEDARKAFEILFEKNLIAYNTLVDGYSKNYDTDEAFQVFNQIEDCGFGVDAFTFASLLSGAAVIGTGGKGEQIHARLLKAGFESNQFVCNALISMYSRCGNIEAAFQVFSDLEDRNIVSWTSIITGFAKHGFANKALRMFHNMLESGVKPNEVTYIAVLTACSHVGLIDEGWEHFRSMYEIHRISPRMEHYACMVDLLGRAGQVEKAHQFIKSMPLKSDALVWRTLLGACRIHGNTDLGEHAAKMILEQDPNDGPAHILLSNLYASRGLWDQVVRIRKSLKERDLIKEAGCSWIELESRVHKFYVGDTSHPLVREIYKELDALIFKIREMGYVPDTNFVLHDVEEEDKEQYLYQHSEKIAVAFGLISTSKPKPIRIFKNLRICGDCHTAIKYISKATGRKIVLRDSNRFHHIKDGVCSCNDYW